MDACVATDTQAWYEVGNHPSFMQLSEVARAMLMGVTRKPSMFTSVMVKFTPPKGLTWTVTEDGRGLLDFESMSVMDLLKSGAEITLGSVSETTKITPLIDTRSALEILDGQPNLSNAFGKSKAEPDLSKPV